MFFSFQISHILLATKNIRHQNTVAQSVKNKRQGLISCPEMYEAQHTRNILTIDEPLPIALS